jgi:hypothetical protein
MPQRHETSEAALETRSKALGGTITGVFLGHGGA